MTQHSINIKNQILEVTSLHKVEESAIPLFGMEWPVPEAVDSDVPMVIIANDEVCFLNFHDEYYYTFIINSNTFIL